jgi:hypothetical protein
VELGNYERAIVFAIEFMSTTYALSCITLTMILYELLVKQAQYDYSTGYGNSIDNIT